MRVLQINSIVNSGSTGRIAVEINKVVIKKGHKGYIAGGLIDPNYSENAIKIGNILDHYRHAVKTRLLDRHGFGSRKSTRDLIKIIENINPDLVHLHNIHGYYINIEILFEYIKKSRTAVIWTFHDCWPFTGHCSYFDSVACIKWQTHCHDCPLSREYPGSWLIDNSRRNYSDKRELFTGISKMVLVTPSKWLANHLKESFLKEYKIELIRNGIDLAMFRPTCDDRILSKYGIKHKYIMGIAGLWTARKGYQDFLKLRENLDKNLEIVLVGLNQSQIINLSKGIIGIPKTENIYELACLYSSAEILVNPTYVDNFPSVNLESLACGTPVITYDTGGSPEAIDKNTGIIVKKGSIEGILEAIRIITQSAGKYTTEICRNRAISYYSNEKTYNRYLELYNELLHS